MLKAEELLLELVQAGKVKFTEKDLKGVKSIQKRKLLYTLGAYKNITIDKNIIDLFGIRKAKKFIKENIQVTNIYSLLKVIYKDELNNYFSITGIDFNELKNSSRSCYSMVRTLPKWSNYKRGKDLFIKGLGTFDINRAFNDYKNVYNYDNMITPSALVTSGYLGSEFNYYAENALKHNKDLFKWIIIHGFNSRRIDELIDLDVLGMWRKDLNVDSVENRLNDMKVRGLELGYKDRKVFKYPKHILDFASEIAFTVPKNGIDLKKQAKIFSNCSGAYVNKILENRSYIIYSSYEMIELTTKGKIVQHLGKRNLELPIEYRRNMIEISTKFMLK